MQGAANNVGVGIDAAAALGLALAVVCSWSRNRSILWGIFHGLCGWMYVIYFAITRQPDERK
jgi:hypothetical protein